jgi:hypothetical protein
LYSVTKLLSCRTLLYIYLRYLYCLITPPAYNFHSAL